MGKICLRCGQDKTPANYIALNHNLLLGDSMPVCRDCVNSIIAADSSWNSVNKICQIINIPFVPEEWEKIAAAKGKDAFSCYCSLFRQKEYETLEWQEYNDLYLRLKDADKVEKVLPETQQRMVKQLRQKWGEQYDEKQLDYLEHLHKGMLESSNVVGVLNEDQALKLCRYSLILEEKIRAGDDISKDLKAYNDLIEIANLSPKLIKSEDEFEGVSDLMSYAEVLGFKPKYYTDIKRDEVDTLIQSTKAYARYMYVNESGIGEEIRERIESLKVAAELSGQNFDEKEFIADCRNFAEEDNEEFNIDY